MAMEGERGRWRGRENRKSYLSSVRGLPELDIRGEAVAGRGDPSLRAKIILDGQKGINNTNK